jgi:hypothetical protein
LEARGVAADGFSLLRHDPAGGEEGGNLGLPAQQEAKIALPEQEIRAASTVCITL